MKKYKVLARQCCEEGRIVEVVGTGIGDEGIYTCPDCRTTEDTIELEIPDEVSLISKNGLSWREPCPCTRMEGISTRSSLAARLSKEDPPSNDNSDGHLQTPAKNH